MTDRERFLKAIEADPYDLHTRKVYADWLDEFGSDTDADVAAEQRAWTREKQDAVVYLTDFATWLTQYAEENGQYREHNFTFDSLLAGLTAVADGDSYPDELFCSGFDHPDRCREEEDQLWRAWELVTGRSLDGLNPHGTFHCSC